jgi:hypothetical protein
VHELARALARERQKHEGSGGRGLACGCLVSAARVLRACGGVGQLAWLSHGAAWLAMAGGWRAAVSLLTQRHAGEEGSNSPTHSVFSTLANTARNTAHNTTANTACNSMRINADDLAAAIAMRQQGSSSLGSRHPLSFLVPLYVCAFPPRTRCACRSSHRGAPTLDAAADALFSARLPYRARVFVLAPASFSGRHGGGNGGMGACMSAGMGSASLSLPSHPQIINGAGPSGGAGRAESGMSSLVHAEAEFMKALKRLEYERAQHAGA